MKRIELPDESLFGILSEENRGIIHAIGTRVASDTLENPGTAIKNSGEMGGHGGVFVSDREFFSAIIDDANAFHMLFRDGEGMLNRGDDRYNLFSGEAADSAANFNRIDDSSEHCQSSQVRHRQGASCCARARPHKCRGIASFASLRTLHFVKYADKVALRDMDKLAALILGIRSKPIVAAIVFLSESINLPIDRVNDI